MSKPDSAVPQTGATVKGYRTLSDDEIAMMNELKKTSALFISQLEIAHRHIDSQVVSAKLDTSGEELARLNNAEPRRWLAMAKTDIQRACMAACRAIAQPSGDS